MSRRHYFSDTEHERKVHFGHDQQGAVIPGTKRLFANTLCKMNSNVPDTHITDDPSKVTCKICRRDARFQALLAHKPIPSVGLHTQVFGRALRPGFVNGMRTRYRRTWRGKLVLQVEVQVPVNYDESDPREIRAIEDVPHTGRWRDATLADLGAGVI